MARFARYTRISKDHEGKALGVQRQLKDIDAKLTADGHELGPSYQDNSISAAGKAKRPAYEQMIGDWEAGLFDGIAAWDIDRLWRVPREFEELLDAAENKGLKLVTVGGDADLSTDNGILYARIKVAVANDELKKRSARQKAKFRQQREEGKPRWNKPLFGYDYRTGEVVPEEAEAIRYVVARLIEGESLSAMARYLNDLGLTTATGAKWQSNTLGRVAGHERYAALKTFDGEQLSMGWEPIITPDQWRQLHHILKDPSRRIVKVNHEYEALLSGIAVCGKCGGSMYLTRSTKKLADGTERLRHIYKCSMCSRTSKEATQTDTHVMLRTLARVVESGTEETDIDEAKLSELRGARAELVRQWEEWEAEAAEALLSPSTVAKAQAAHVERLKAVEADIASLERVSLFRLPTPEELTWDELTEGGPGPAKTVGVFNWYELSLAKRRNIVRGAFERIIIHGAGKGARWSADTIELVPRSM